MICVTLNNSGFKMFHSFPPQKETDISVERLEKEKAFGSQKKISMSVVH
jgi:hypothetical protein